MTVPGSRFGGLVGPAAVMAAAGVALAIGPPGDAHRRAVGFAAASCLAGSIAAWLAGCWPATTPSARVTAALAATVLRLFPALLALGWLQTGGAELAAAGAGESLVVFYLASLAAELVRTIMAGTARSRPPRDDEVI